MAIQVVQITGDTVELVFNPAEDHLHVGENLSIAGRHEDRGLIVQIIELSAIFSTPMPSSRSQRILEGSQFASPTLTNPPSRSPRRRKSPLPPHEISGFHRAIAKIRKMTNHDWHPWDGWIPMHGLIVTRTADHEVLRQCTPESDHPLRLGKTLAGEPFHVERAALGEVNLIVGGKRSETSHLVKVILSELIDQGVRCVVFDTTGAYAQFSSDREGSSISGTEGPAIVHLVVGESLKLGMPPVGLDALPAMLRQFGLPKALALYFESHVARRLVHSKGQDDANQPPLVLGIGDLVCVAEDLEAEGQAVVGGAILSCLDAVKKTHILATRPAEAMAFGDGYAQIRHGGALMIDLSRVPRRARTGIVCALVGILKDLAAQEIVTESNHAPFMFFDDTQPLVPRHFIADVLMPARPLGLTSFFVTPIAMHLEDTLLYEADNLFLQHMTSEDDIRHLVHCGLVDAETLRGVGRRLRKHHSLVIGEATQGYPIIFAVNPLGDVELASATSAFSRPPARAMPRLSTGGQTSAEMERSLPLFPDETPVRSLTPDPCNDEPISASSQPPTPTVAQVTATWDHIVKRVARRRRILETILSTARPLRIDGQQLVLGFPPQHRFQQELVESDEYRSLLQEELEKTFGLSLEVTTEVYPA